MSKITTRLRHLCILCAPMLCTGCDWIMDGEDPTGCQQRVRIEVDWSQFNDTEPAGMSVILYEDGSTTPSVISSNELEYVHATVSGGTYHAAVINNSPQEYTRLTFEGMQSMTTALLTTQTVTDSWFSSRSTLVEKISQQPETFAYDVATYLTVTDSTLMSASTPTLVRLTPVIVTKQVEVIVRAEGLEHVTEMTGALTGMAAGYYPNLERPSRDRATFLTDDWTVTHGGARISTHSSSSDEGTRAGSGYTLRATLNTFGLPYEHQGYMTENILILQATLTDGTTYEQSYPVGNKFTRISDEMLRVTVSTTFSVPTPTQRPASGSGSSGFDASVDNWGESDDFNFAM